MNYKPLILFFFALSLIGCEEDPEYDYIQLAQGELFTHDLNLSGDEQSAYIIKQAFHFERSEIVRDSSTDWSAVYFYVPEAEFIGFDYVVIEVCTSGSGAECAEEERIILRFEVLE